MQIIAAYVGETRHVLEDSGQILSRANQALATLERYKLRLDEVVQHPVGPRDRGPRHRPRRRRRSPSGWRWCTRIAREIEDYVLELGTDGRLLSLQLEELITGVDTERELVIRDYLPARAAARRSPEALLTRLESLSPTELVDPAAVARALGLGASEHLDGAVAPRGYRLLAKVPRLPRPSSTGWSTTSAPCRSCCPPASTTCRPSRASASCAPAASARASPGWPSRASSSATSDRRCPTLPPSDACGRLASCCSCPTPCPAAGPTGPGRRRGLRDRLPARQGRARTARRTARRPGRPRSTWYQPGSAHSVVPCCSPRRSGGPTRSRSTLVVDVVAGHDVDSLGTARGQSWLDQMESSPEVILTTSVDGETRQVQAGSRRSCAARGRR